MVRLGRPEWGRFMTAGLGLLLLVLVAVGTRAGTQTLPNPAGPAMTVVTLVAETLVLCALVAGVLILIANIWVLFPLKKRRLQSRPHSFLRTVLSALLLLGLVYLVSLWRMFRHGRPRGTASANQLLSGPSPASTGLIFHTGFEWIPILVTVGLVAAAAGLLVIRLGPRSRPEPPLSSPPPALTGAVDMAMRALHEARDPREAVIAAYLHLERQLAAYGLPRRRWETPAEYLERVLAPLSALTTPLRRLTGLFELARFSRREIPEACRHDAIQALAAVRVGLAPGQPPA
jgi:hypothetical protein